MATGKFTKNPWLGLNRIITTRQCRYLRVLALGNRLSTTRAPKMDLRQVASVYLSNGSSKTAWGFQLNMSGHS